MDFTAGLFEHDVEFDNSARVAARQAVSVAHKRAKDRFGSFLAAASASDFHQRWALVEDELADVVADTVEEYGGDPEGVLAAVTSVLAAGGFCDDCRKWKSGPKKGCECGSAKGTEPSAEMDDSKGDDESGDSGTIAKVAMPYVNQDTGNEIPLPHEVGLPNNVAIPGEHPCGHCGQGVNNVSTDVACPHCGHSTAGAGLDQLSQGLGDMINPGKPANPSKPWDPQPEAGDGFDHSSAHVAKWTVITADDKTGLGGPSPKMDKKEWKPNALNDKGNLKPIKTEGKDSPNPTDDQDISDVPDHTKDPLEHTDAVAKHDQPLDKAHKEKAQHTDTWHGKGDQADPVTSAAQDVDRNPLRDMIEQGVVPDAQIQAAISQFEQP
jgi:hypothetical protein